MNGLADARMNEQTNARMNEWANERIHEGGMNESADERMRK